MVLLWLFFIAWYRIHGNQTYIPLSVSSHLYQRPLPSLRYTPEENYRYPGACTLVLVSKQMTGALLWIIYSGLFLAVRDPLKVHYVVISYFSDMLSAG